MVPLARQIKAVQRELALRQKVYPRLVASGQMAQREADDELEAMRAVLTTVQMAALAASQQMALFPEGE